MDLKPKPNNGRNGPTAGSGSDEAEDNEVEMSSCQASQQDMDGVEEAVEGAAALTCASGGDAYKTEEGEDEKPARSCVLKMLDEMDGRVEKLRSDTTKVKAERDDILSTLDTLSNSQLVHDLEGIDLDEVNRYIKRLAQRSAAVHVEISTERSVPQQESLHVVNTLIDALIREVKSDVVTAKRRCIAYMNSCSDEADALFQENCGIDAPFEAAVLGCTLEDQKRVKKRLNGLYSYFLTYSSDGGHSSAALSKIKEENENVGSSSAGY